jgi:hypothetical protein
MKTFYRVGFIALLLTGVMFAGGVAEAASPSAQKVCVNKQTGVKRYLRKTGKQTCKKSERKLIRNKAGATGATGANGALTNSQTKNICGVNGTTACAVGRQGPGGGIVFMTPSTLGNTSGLFYEAAPSTWSSPSGDPTSAWCNNTTDLLGVASTVAGINSMDGVAKSTVMLGVCTSGAANLADAYTATVNGVVYGDWFLPSKGELVQIYVNRFAIGGFSSGTYWSSSEYGAKGARYQRFNPNNQANGDKNLTYYVRPVRVF